MTPREVEHCCEEIKRHLRVARDYHRVERRQNVRKEIESVAIIFNRLCKDGGDALGIHSTVQKSLQFCDFSEEEYIEYLSPKSVHFVMKAKKQAQESKEPKDNDKKSGAVNKAPYVQPQYHLPPKKLKGFPNAVPVKGKGHRDRWVDKKAKRIYEWDYQHGHVEGWSKTGKEHKGAFNPNDGNMVKPPDPTKKAIIPEVVLPIEKTENYALAWYCTDDETLVDEVLLELSTDQVRKWFHLSEDDPAVYCYDLTASPRRHLIKRVNVDIDLNEYDYQLKGRVKETGQ